MGNPTELVSYLVYLIVQPDMMQGQRYIQHLLRSMLFFLLMGACLAPIYSPDGAAGEHKFTPLKPVFIHDGEG